MFQFLIKTGGFMRKKAVLVGLLITLFPLAALAEKARSLPLMSGVPVDFTVSKGFAPDTIGKHLVPNIEMTFKGNGNQIEVIGLVANRKNCLVINENYDEIKYPLIIKFGEKVSFFIPECNLIELKINTTTYD